MNRSNFMHAAQAVFMQAVIGLVTGNWWAGAAFGAAFFIGREHAQAEYRYIEANGGSRYDTPEPPEIAALNPRWWSKDAVLDFVFPVIAVVAVAVSTSWI